MLYNMYILDLYETHLEIQEIKKKLKKISSRNIKNWASRITKKSLYPL